MFPISSYYSSVYFSSWGIISFFYLSHYASTSIPTASGYTCFKSKSPIYLFIIFPFYPLWRINAPGNESNVAWWASDLYFLVTDINISPIIIFLVLYNLLYCVLNFTSSHLFITVMYALEFYHSNNILKITSVWAHPDHFIEFLWWIFWGVNLHYFNIITKRSRFFSRTYQSN